MFLQKQTAFTGRWEVTIDYQVPQEGHEAGTAVWWSKYAYASLAIKGGEDGQRYLVFRSPDPDSDSQEANNFLVSQTLLVLLSVSFTLLTCIGEDSTDRSWQIGPEVCFPH
jgi:hypothetical protein